MLACGRRWGKDRLSVWLCLSIGFVLAAARTHLNDLYPKVHQWVVAPTDKLSDQLWREYKVYTASIPGRHVEEVRKRITLPGDYVIEFRSTHKPEVLQGVGLDIMHITEAAKVSDEAWTEYLVQTRHSPGRLGFACINGTPGTTPSEWYQGIWRRGLSSDPGVSLVNQPSWDNPHLTAPQLSEIRAEKAELPEAKFRTTYGAELIPEAGGVFRRVRDAHRADVEPPRSGGQYVSFYDPARTVDFNGVVTLYVDGDGRIRQAYADRWNDVEWGISKQRLVRLRDYPGELYIDTGFDPYGRDKRNPFVKEVQGVVGPALHCRGYKFTNENKEKMTDNLAVLLEQARIDLLDPVKCVDPMRGAVEAQIRELEKFRAHRLPSGMVRYAAPDGEHDDMAISVMAAALLLGERGGDVPEWVDKVGFFA